MWVRWAPVVLAAVAAGAPSVVGHTRTLSATWLMVAADVAHLLAAAVWVGGVTGLVVHLGLSRRAARTDRSLTGMMLGFSRLALFGVALLAASGLVMGVQVLDSPGELVGTPYGRLLLLKLGIVAAVVALAAWNRWHLLPAVRRHPDGALRWAALVRVLRHEAALLMAVVAVTGILANTSPGLHDHRPREVAVAATSQALTVEGVMAPGRVGENRLVMTLTFDGAPVTDAEVTVTARLTEPALGPLTAVAVPAADGTHVVDLSLPAAGDWELQVSARVSRFEQPIALIPVRIP